MARANLAESAMKIESEAIDMFRRHQASFREHARAAAATVGAASEDYIALLWQELRARDAAIEEAHLVAQSARVRVMQARQRLRDGRRVTDGT
jgi:hypothetical protein